MITNLAISSSINGANAPKPLCIVLAE